MPQIGPTREQFLSIPRSRTLRFVSLQLLTAFEALLHETWRRDQLSLQIKQMYDCLIEAGITAGKNKGLREDAYNEPVTAAEYLAGQLVDYAERTAIPPCGTLWCAQEQRALCRFPSAWSSPLTTREFVARQEMVFVIRTMFAYESCDEVHI